LAVSPKPQPCPERWLGLIGKYGSSGGTAESFLVLEKDGQLQLLGQAYQWLSEKGRDTFSMTGDPNRPVIFSRDSLGQAVTCASGGQQYSRIPYPGEPGTARRQARGLALDSLWREARRARPPRERGRFASADLVEIRDLAPEIVVDQDYADPGNTYGFSLYDREAAYLQRPAAKALARASGSLRKFGFILKIGDAYRPWHVTKFLRLAAPPSERQFYANPAKGSHHNRGTAIDATLVDLATGREADMGYGEDELSERAASDFPGGTSLQRWNRLALRTALEREGFRNLRTEWWHFRFISRRRYPIMNLPLSRAGRVRPAARAGGR